MIRYTTPKISILVDNADLNEFDSIHVTFAPFVHSGVILDIENPAIEGNRLIVELTQKQSSWFKVGQKVYAQVNAMKGTKRYAGNPMPFEVTENLLKKVIE